MIFLIAYIFARIGSKRVIGGVTSFLLVLLLWPVGVMLVLQSRRLDDERMNAELIEKFKPAQIPAGG